MPHIQRSYRAAITKHTVVVEKSSKGAGLAFLVIIRGVRIENARRRLHGVSISAYIQKIGKKNEKKEEEGRIKAPVIQSSSAELCPGE